MNTLEVFARDWVALSAPDEEDGERREVIVWNVIARNADGEQFCHEVTFATEAEAERLAARVTTCLKGGGHLDMDRWVEIDPAYGSKAYQAFEAGGGFANEGDREDEGFTFFGHGGWR